MYELRNKNADWINIVEFDVLFIVDISYVDIAGNKHEELFRQYSDNNSESLRDTLIKPDEYQRIEPSIQKSTIRAMNLAKSVRLLPIGFGTSSRDSNDEFGGLINDSIFTKVDKSSLYDIFPNGR